MVWIPPLSGPGRDEFDARFAGWRGVVWGFAVVSILVVGAVALGVDQPFGRDHSFGADHRDSLVRTAFGFMIGATMLLGLVFFLPLKRASVIGNVLVTILYLVSWVLVGVAVAPILLIVIGVATSLAGLWGYRQWRRRVSRIP